MQQQLRASRQNALITGASKGIGRCYAKRLAAMGYNVLLVASTEADLSATAAEIKAEYPNVEVHYYVKDLATPKAADELYAWCDGNSFEPDVLINNAGMFSFCDILNTPAERIERIITLHAITATQLCRLFAADMIERGEGHILNMSSFSIWMPYPGLSLYSASKAYLKSFSVAFSKEVRSRGVKVTAVCPAGIATDLYGLSPELQRFGLKTGILMSADSCARRGLKALFKGRRCVVPDWWFRLFIPICQCLCGAPMRWLRNFTMKFQK